MRRVTLAFAATTVIGMVMWTAHAQRPNRPGGSGGDRQGPGRFDPIMRIFDTNRDGVLTEQEIQEAAAKLKELDSSKDGKVTSEEVRAKLFGQGRGSGAQGRQPFAGGGPGRGPAGGAGGSDFEKEPLPQDDTEKQILNALTEMREGPRFANVSPMDGRLLRILAETVNAKRVVEIGTSTGESAVWLALALRTTGGHLFTHEIDEGRAEVARKNFKMAGVEDTITLIMGDAHETVKQHKEPIDILFLDADKEGYIDYLDKLLPVLRPGGLVIAHNMNTRQADANYVKAITENPKLETLILLKEGMGVGVTLKKRP
jgi:caffeoyl-CoA O-methyltransferase